MPELPDVENFGRFLQQRGLHKKILGVTVSSAKVLAGVSGPALARRLEGHALESVRRHGKHLLAATDDGHYLAFHFGMTGRFAQFKDGEEDPKHDRLRLDFPHGEHLAFLNQRLFGRVEWVEDADEFIRRRKLGPDALAVDEKTFRERIGAKRGALKAVLMDQSVLAGIGNVYSDEILYHAKLHPKLTVADLDDKRAKRLFRQMRRVLEKAVEKGAGAEDLEKRVPRTWLLAHRAEGAACPLCDGKIATLKIGSRTAYYCPTCQRAPAHG